MRQNIGSYCKIEMFDTFQGLLRPLALVWIILTAVGPPPHPG